MKILRLGQSTAQFTTGKEYDVKFFSLNNEDNPIASIINDTGTTSHASYKHSNWQIILDEGLKDKFKNIQPHNPVIDKRSLSSEYIEPKLVNKETTTMEIKTGVTLISGKISDDVSDKELLDLIKAESMRMKSLCDVNQDIWDLSGTRSETLSAQQVAHKENIAALVKILDGRNFSE